jgi:hypothetical protein
MEHDDDHNRDGVGINRDKDGLMHRYNHAIWSYWDKDKIIIY